MTPIPNPPFIELPIRSCNPQQLVDLGLNGYHLAGVLDGFAIFRMDVSARFVNPEKLEGTGSGKSNGAGTGELSPNVKKIESGKAGN